MVLQQKFETLTNSFVEMLCLTNFEIVVNTFHPLSTIVIHTFNLCKVQSMDDNCGEWVECMGVASGCGEQEVGVASGSGWNLWVWLLGVV